MSKPNKTYDGPSDEKAQKLLDFGAELAGTAASGALGFFAAGPAGAAVGAVAGPVITRTLSIAIDVARRQLSEREKVRTGAGLAFAIEKISINLESGLEPRDDGFFDSGTSERSHSHEILEGVLLKCRDQTEEKKVRLLGNIYANVSFRTDISIPAANWLIQVADGLTYRQLCMISLIQQKENKRVSWGPNDGDPTFILEYRAIEDFIARDKSQSAFKHERETGASRRVTGLSKQGTLVYELMNLDEIPEKDLKRLSRHFPGAFED